MLSSSLFDFSGRLACSQYLKTQDLSSQQVVAALCKLSQRVADMAMSLRGSTNLSVSVKADSSRVTNLDTDISDYCKSALPAICDAPVYTEESFLELDVVNEAPVYWLVDPIDGTQSFLEGKNSFATSIALVISGLPAVGMILQPAKNMVVIGGPEIGVIKADVDGAACSFVEKDFARDPLVMTEPLQESTKRERWVSTLLSEKFERMPACISAPSPTTNRFIEFLDSDANHLLIIRKRAWDFAAAFAIARALGMQVIDPVQGEQIFLTNFESQRMKFGAVLITP